jgi:hypothetical protein
LGGGEEEDVELHWRTVSRRTDLPGP